MNKLQRVQQLLRFERAVCLAHNAQRRPVAGFDEVGRGPLAGPVVAGAVILKSRSFRVPIDDSKKLTPRAREIACREILQKAHVGIGAVWPEEIDRIGIQKAVSVAMLRAFQRLPVKPVLVLVDGPRSFAGCTVLSVPIIDGDAKSISIACASIVAKVIRDRWMERLHRLIPHYGFLSHKGYGTPGHLKALKEIGPSEFHRFSFRPVCAQRRRNHFLGSLRDPGLSVRNAQPLPRIAPPACRTGRRSLGGRSAVTVRLHELI